MSNEKHTPGPWRVNNEEEIRDSRGVIIASIMCDTKLCLNDMRANIRLMAAAPELLDALSALLSNEHIDLGDMVYNVKEREGKGWEGPSVKAWGEAVEKAKELIKKATE